MTARPRRARTSRLSALVAAVLLAALVTASCNAAVTPDETSIDVNTPKLQEMKKGAGIETCVPGPGGGGLPALTLPCLGGGPDVDLSSLKGPLLINLWYSGCGPCRDEMPVLQDYYEKHGDEVGVLGLDVENYPEAAISFAGMVGATYPQIADPGGYIFDQADLKLRPAYPQTIFVDADGRVSTPFTGTFDSLAEIEDFVTAQADLP